MSSPAVVEGMVRSAALIAARSQASLRSGRRDIEVFRLPLRDTVNEGDDGSGSPAAQEHEEAEPARAMLRTASSASSTASVDSLESAGALLPSPPPQPKPQEESSPTPPPPVRRNSKEISRQPSLRDSGRVVLVTRPSQRDIEQWTERATSTMVRSSGGTVRMVTPTQQSRRWVLEYKPVVSHSGWLIKRGHSIRNFKRRLFCIIDHELVYHDAHDSTDVRGRIDLRKRTTVQCLLQSGFSLNQGSYQVILYALDQNDRDEWIKSLQEQGVELLPASAKTAKLIEQQTNSAEKHPIVFSGWLRKRGQMFKSTKRRWFELSTTTLSYFSHPEGGTKKGSIEVAHARISPLDTLKTGERFSFVVHTSQRELILHADSQEERSLWVASLSSVAEGNFYSSDSTEASMSVSSGSFIARERGRGCSCATGSFEEGNVGADSSCRRCMSSFISKAEDALVDVTREVQLILASPYSPEGSTTAAFLKEQAGKPIENAALREFMVGLSDYMVHKRLHELRVLGGRSGSAPHDADGCGDDNCEGQEDSAEFTERVVAIIGEQIEERVFFPLYRMVHDNIKAQSRAESKLLRGKIEVLQAKSQSFFGIGQNSLSSTSWVSACTKLKEIDRLSLPYMKRDQLVAACKEIYNVYHTEHPTNAPMSADDFIPAFIYVLVQSRLSDPVFVKEMITFFDLGATQGEAAYFVTCLEIAIEYIRSLVTACTVVLDAGQKLGIEFARDHDRDVIVVYRLVAGGQAEQSQAVNIGDVLVAVNGVLVYEMDLTEITKMVTGIEGEIELCLLPMDEYERRFGMAKRGFRDDDDLDSCDEGDHTAEDNATPARRKESLAKTDLAAAGSGLPPAPRISSEVSAAEILGAMVR